jgi:hypothetical protein
MRNGEFNNYFKDFIMSEKEINKLVLESHENFIFPDDEDIENFIGMKYGERNYNRDVDWALSAVLNLPPEGGLILVPGTRPWETGTTQIKEKKNQWFTFNGENMFSLPINKMSDDIFNLLNSFKGSRTQYIKAKKQIYYQLCPNAKAYYNHSNEMWGWSVMSYNVVDFIYDFFSKQIQEIKYDYLKLNKYIAFYWS